MKRKLFLTLSTFIFLSLGWQKVFAEAKCTMNGQTVPCNQMPTGLFVVGFGFVLFMVLSALAFTVFWVWMIIDIATNEEENKALWLILILLFTFPVSLVYYFTRYRPRIKQQKNKLEGGKNE